MSTRTGGPQTPEGKAITRYNAATHGIYSVTPVLPKVERESEWLAHRAGVFADLAPEGYMQEVFAERIALTTWRLRRLIRFEREQVRTRQRGLMDDLKTLAMYEHRNLEKEPLDKDLELLDSWAMSALIPREKELMLLMRYEGHLTRHLRLDMLQLEHMQRQRREGRPLVSIAEPEPEPPAPRPDPELVLSLAQPESKDPAREPESLGELLALRSATEAESKPVPGYPERDPEDPALRPAEPESLGEPHALRLSWRRQ
jgi:hypothetical protein